MTSCLEPANYRRDIWPHRHVRSNRGGKLAITKDNPNTRWFRHVDGKGFCALHHQGRIRRVKGIYTFPEWRGFGVGTEMTLALFAMAKADPECQVIEAWTVNPDFYLPHGFRLVGSNAHGSSRVKLELTRKT